MYAKIAADGTDPAKIVFIYNRDTLFDDVALMSNYMAKNLTTKDGNYLTDEFAISDDERELADVSINATLPDIYEAMIKITNAVVPAFEEDVYISSGGTGIPPVVVIGEDISGNDVEVGYGHYVTFYIQDNAAYNANVLTMVDASLYNCLKRGALKEFYSTVVQADFFKLCAERFVAELFKLKQRLFQLKRKSVVSNPY